MVIFHSRTVHSMSPLRIVLLHSKMKENLKPCCMNKSSNTTKVYIDPNSKIDTESLKIERLKSKYDYPGQILSCRVGGFTLNCQTDVVQKNSEWSAYLGGKKLQQKVVRNASCCWKLHQGLEDIQDPGLCLFSLALWTDDVGRICATLANWRIKEKPLRRIDWKSKRSSRTKNE